MRQSRKPSVAAHIGYHAFLTCTDHSGKRRTCYFQSMDDSAWLMATELYDLLLMAHLPSLHRWRGPMVTPSDPTPSGMKPGDDYPW